MRLQSFTKEADAVAFETAQRSSGWLTKIEPPTRPGARNLEGRWVVWYW